MRAGSEAVRLEILLRPSKAGLVWLSETLLVLILWILILWILILWILILWILLVLILLVLIISLSLLTLSRLAENGYELPFIVFLTIVVNLNRFSAGVGRNTDDPAARHRGTTAISQTARVIVAIYNRRTERVAQPTRLLRVALPLLQATAGCRSKCIIRGAALCIRETTQTGRLL